MASFLSGKSSGSSGGFLSGGGSKKKAKSPYAGYDLETPEGLQAYAEAKGLPVEVKKPKLSFLQRLGRGLSALEPVNAFYEAKYDGKNFAIEYIKDIVQEAGSAITGHEKRTDTKKQFKDLLIKQGMKDEKGKINLVDVAGLTGDILTDPGTWFGGSIMKLGGKAVGATAKGVEKVGMAVAPKQTGAIVEGLTKAKTALGEAFIPAYGASKASRKAGIEFVEDTAVTDLKKMYNEAIDDGLQKEQFVKTFEGVNADELSRAKRVKELESVYDELAAVSATKQVSKLDTLKNAYEQQPLEELVKKQKDIIDDFRKESDLMAERGGAGVTLRNTYDATGAFVRQIKDFNLNKAKKSMAFQKEQAVQYADQLLTESDPVYKALKEAIEKKKALEINTLDTTKIKDPMAALDEIDLKTGIKKADTTIPTVSETVNPLVKRIEELAKEPVTAKAVTPLEPTTPIFDKFIDAEAAGLKLGKTVYPKALEPYVDEALKHGDAESFAKNVTKADLGGIDPKKFYDDVVDKTPMYEKIQKYNNKVQIMREQVGKLWSGVFKALPDSVKEDLVDGMITVRKQFGQMREKLVKEGFDEENITKELVNWFDRRNPNELFKDPETVSFFTKSLLPELISQRKFVSEVTGLAEDMMMQAYFPFIKKTTIQNLNSAMAKLGKQGYAKKFKGVLGKDEIIVDPAEAYATRAAEVAKDGLTLKFLKEIVDGNGKPLTAFANSDAAKAAGYRVIKSQGMYGKELGYLPEIDAKYINEIYDPSYKVLTNIARSTGYDWGLNLFKKSVTGLFVPFHIRNAASGVLQNFEALGAAALRPDNIAEGIPLIKKVLSETKDFGDDVMKFGDVEYRTQDVVTAIREKFNISSQYISDYGMESIEKLNKTGASKYTPFELGRLTGQYIEGHQKATAVITALKKGYDLPEALRLAEKAGFDYSMLTPFERNVMRRLIPFYSYARKNIELQLTTLAKNPERIGTLTKAFRSAGTTQSTDGQDGLAMPEWMRNRFSVRIGNSKNNLPQVMSGFGTPVESFSSLFQDGLLGAMTMLNPMIKVPIERATGKDFFRKTDLKDVYDAKEYSNAPQFIKDWLKIKETKNTPIYKDGVATGEFKTKYVADPMRLHIARNLFTSRAVSYLDTIFGETELSPEANQWKIWTGIRPYEIDEELQKYFEDRNNSRELIDFLTRYGVIKTFDKAYIPKQEKFK